jgi:hypothetical protein
MNISFLKQRKNIILIAIGVFLLILIVGLIYYFLFVKKDLQLKAPNGKEVLSANKTYQIRWKAKKIGRVGIMLVKEGEQDQKSTEWIAQDVSALDGKYDWNIFVWQEPRQDYRIYIFEYPWKEGNKSDYSDAAFTILGPSYASCDSLSVESEWPFLPSDYPNLRMAFITQQEYNGNLEGLDGADKKCQAEAESQGLPGTWKALLGDDKTVATDRLNLDGIFVNAISAGQIPENKTCHQLWGNNFDDFFKKLSNSVAINSQKFSSEFLQKDLSDIWLGRINKDSISQCTIVTAKFPSIVPDKIYSFTTTCQNWRVGQEVVAGYPPVSGETPDYPKCYNSQGQRLNAVSLSGLSSGITGPDSASHFSPNLGKLCDTGQKLMCVQQ